MTEPEYTLRDFLQTILAERSPDLCFIVDSQPTLTVDGQLTIFDVPPVNSDKMDAFFQTVAPAPKVQQLKSNGCTQFLYDFEATKSSSPVIERFRVEAKTANGRIVSLRFNRVPATEQSI
jgi:hypothetical protein